MANDTFCQKCGSRLSCDACRAGADDGPHTLGTLSCPACGWSVDVRPLVLERIGSRPYSIAEFNSIAEDILREPGSVPNSHG